MKIAIKIRYILLLGTLLFFYACAKQVAISGGPKDTSPPEIVYMAPANGTINFNEKSIYIKFNEYIKLNDLNQKLIVSPPIDEKPDVAIKGKGIKIKLDVSLLEPNMTYCLNFNDAIADNNEGNVLNSFVYAFSTGNKIDSLSFSGHVLDAFTKEPVKDAWVILHDVFADSVIKTYNPAYITKVDDEGKFFIPFVRDNKYKIYALIDNNYNYLFDIPQESIAFIDTIYQPKVKKIEFEDSLGNIKYKYKKYPDNLELLLFKEQTQSQFIKDNKRLKPDYIEIVFNSTQYEKYSVVVPQDKNAIVYAKQNPDTVKVWLKNQELIKSDSINVIVTYTDPVYTDSIKTDTLFLNRPKTHKKDTLINVATNKVKEPHKPLSLFVNIPINKIEPNLMKLEFKPDSIYIPIDFKVIKDSINPLIINISAQILEKTDYRIVLDKGFLSTEDGLYNDIDTLKFSSISTLEYGNLKLTFTDTESNYIVQILDGDKIVYEKVSIGGVTDFQFIKPKEYKIRAIKDLNSNGRWDTGNYDKHIQPEPVFYYPKNYEIKANWNHELDWSPIIKK